MKNIRIYLSGSIQKGKADVVKKSVWTDSDIATLHEVLANAANISLLNPVSRSDDLSDHESVLGRDLLQVYISDLVLVDARDRKGIGIGAEMMFAKEYGIPVISVSPQNSQYRKERLEYIGQQIENWIHPFIGGLSDYVAESVYDAAVYIRENYPFDKRIIKNKDSMISMMRYYIETQLERDIEMHNLATKDHVLLNRIERVKYQFDTR